MGNVLGRILPSSNYSHRQDIYRNNSNITSSTEGYSVADPSQSFRGDNEGTSVDEVTLPVSEVTVILDILEAVRQERLHEVCQQVKSLDDKEGMYNP